MKVFLTRTKLNQETQACEFHVPISSTYVKFNPVRIVGISIAVFLLFFGVCNACYVAFIKAAFTSINKEM